MTRRFTDLIDWDADSRWRILILSIMFCAGCGLVAEMSGSSQLMAKIIAGLAGGSLAVGMAIRYVSAASRLGDSKVGRTNTARDFRTVLIPFIWTSAMLLVLFLLSPAIKGAVVSAQLRSVLSAKPSSLTAAKADHILRLAAKSHARLQPQLVSVASTEASRLDDPNVWSEYISSVNNEVRLRSPNSTAPIRRGDQLDGFNMRDSVFAQERVSYDGGPLNLDNVCFYNVRFEIADSPNGREFANAILSSKNNCVTISLP